MQDQHREHFEALAQIRAMMEQSSRFISLSGLSGVAAGVIALLGALAMYAYLGGWSLEYSPYYVDGQWLEHPLGIMPFTFFLLDAGIVFCLALTLGTWFTWRKAKAQGQSIWTSTSKRLAINILIPLATGGVFCLLVLYRGYYGLVGPAMLIFYGLACVNGSKYTFNDIRSLGIAEIVLGLIGVAMPGYSVLLWALGFGVLHIVYGFVMYRKHA